MAGEIIRLGDSTSHGGRVVEGSPLDICMGKPIAFIGHKVQCPKCKGVFPIIEGAPTTTFYGKGVALAGMKTACGAVLIAGQLTDRVELGGGADQTQRNQTAPISKNTPASNSTAAVQGRVAESGLNEFNDKFILIAADSGTPLANTEYAIRRATGNVEYGTTDAEGHTHLLSSTAQAEAIDIYL